MGHVRNDSHRFPLAVTWSLVGLVVVNVFLAALMEWSPRLKDPEYGIKLAGLRRALAKQPARRPLVLLMGNSRVGTGIRPDYLQRGEPELNAVVYNFGMCGARPVLQLVCLKRLLGDGIRPDWLLLEVFLPQLLDTGRWDADFVEPTRLQARDLTVVARYHSHPGRLYRRWAEAELVPWWSHRMVLFNELAPAWLDTAHRIDANWRGLDSLGWLHMPRFELGSETPGWAEWTQGVRLGYARKLAFRDLPISCAVDSAIREMLGLCREYRIAPAIILMPDRFRDEYAPAARARFDGYVAGLSAEFAARVFDMRSWVPDAGFHDGVHQTPQSAARFSARMGRDVIRPLLAEPALARRVP